MSASQEGQARSHNVGAIVVCRMGSTRLPGKTLLLIDDTPLLSYVLQRCLPVLENGVTPVIATTDEPIDDPIESYARAHELPVFRGDAVDVARRVLGCADHFGFDYFFRINGDSPFVQGSLLATALEEIRDADVDLVTNLLPRSFPYGVAVELVRTGALRSKYPIFSDAEREHVTAHFYANPNDFRIKNLQNAADQSHHRLTVDTPEDWERFKTLVRRFKGSGWHQLGMQQILAALADLE